MSRGDWYDTPRAFCIPFVLSGRQPSKVSWNTFRTITER